MMKTGTEDKSDEAGEQRWRGTLLLLVVLPVIATLSFFGVSTLRGRSGDMAQLLVSGPVVWRVYTNSGGVVPGWAKLTQSTSSIGKDNGDSSLDSRGCAPHEWLTTPIAGRCEGESNVIHVWHVPELSIPVHARDGSAFTRGGAEQSVNNPSRQQERYGALLPVFRTSNQLPRDLVSLPGRGGFRVDAEVTSPEGDLHDWEPDAHLKGAEGQSIHLACLKSPIPLQALESVVLVDNDSRTEAGYLGTFESLVSLEANCPSAFLWR